MKIIITLFVIFTFIPKGHACLNGETFLLKDGTLLYEDREGNVPYGHIFQDSSGILENIGHLDSFYNCTRDLDYLSDKGLLLILIKKYDEAIQLYLEIERIQPGRYSTASNIGTAYELIGQNELALKWIKKAVEIDPKSHNSSEWIHVNILEAKLKNEHFYSTRFLLNTDFGTDASPLYGSTKEKIDNLSNQLYFQLNERVSFVKPPEKIVAQLLFDLGNIAFLRGRLTDALEDYEQAKGYGFSGQLIEKRIAAAKRQSRIAFIIRNLKIVIFPYGISGVIILTMALIIYRQRRIIRRNLKQR